MVRPCCKSSDSTEMDEVAVTLIVEDDGLKIVGLIKDCIHLSCYVNLYQIEGGRAMPSAQTALCFC